MAREREAEELCLAEGAFSVLFLTAAGALLQEVLVLDDVDRDGVDGTAAGGIDWTSTPAPRVPRPLGS